MTDREKKQREILEPIIDDAIKEDHPEMIDQAISELAELNAIPTSKTVGIRTCNGGYCGYQYQDGSLLGCKYEGYCDYQCPKDGRKIKEEKL